MQVDVDEEGADFFPSVVGVVSILAYLSVWIILPIAYVKCRYYGIFVAFVKFWEGEEEIASLRSLVLIKFHKMVPKASVGRSVVLC